MLRMNRFFFSLMAAMAYFIMFVVLAFATGAILWLGYNIAITFI